VDDADAAQELAELAAGTAPAAALAFFDRCGTVEPAGMTGRWRGSGLPTGHPFDGLLEAYGWYGKEIADAETVHPLLFRDSSGRPRAVDPAYAPLALLRAAPGLARLPVARRGFAVLRPLRYTRRPAARVRRVEHRGVVTAALVYDRLPVVDVVRRVAAGTVLGLMDMRGVTAPFFFVLRRDDF
jgi:GXWXG protein/Domain of unknown function (DUF4334)